MARRHVNKYHAAADEAREVRRKRQMCERKLAFDSAEAAACEGNEVYRCPYCHRFHRTKRTTKILNELRRQR